MCDQFFGFHARPGGGVVRLGESFSAKPTVKNLLENSVIQNGRFQGEKMTAEGAYLSPELSFDAQEILFAYTDTTKERRHSLYVERRQHVAHFQGQRRRFRLDTTDGRTLERFRSLLLAQRANRVHFRAARRVRTLPRPAGAQFHAAFMNADGSDIVMLSPHETNEWQPSVDRVRDDRLHALGLRRSRFQPGPPPLDHHARRPRLASDSRQFCRGTRRSSALRGGYPRHPRLAQAGRHRCLPSRPGLRLAGDRRSQGPRRRRGWGRCDV